ncbi:hypothetical protein MMC10_009192 [Thelotrema lepadinum]|nr:hypothetical protein [Thelotrema lepadinum]
MINSLKRAIEVEEGFRKKAKRSVRFQCPTPCAPMHLTDPQSLTNLCRNRNFCDQLRECLQKVPRGGCYVGTLDDVDRYKHLIYFPEKITVKHPARSLQEIIASKQGLIVRLSLFERAHIALSLAKAVLQYHATPWLRSPLRCKDIYFSDNQEGSPKISDLEIDVAITRREIASGIAPAEPDSLIPNATLYNLAVILIELGFKACLDNLLNETKQPESSRDRYTDMLAVKLLAKSVGKEMGSTYQEIVEKYLECHFTAGYDLNNAELQMEYHRDIVQELEKLEEGLRSLNLN